MNNEREEFVQETIEGMAPPYLLETCLTKSKNLNTLSHLHGSDVKPENDLNYPVKIEEDDFLYEADEDKQYDCPVKAEHLKTPCAQPTKGSSRQNDLNYPVKIEEDDFLYEADEDKQYVYVQEDCPVKAEHLKTPCAQPTKGSSRQFNMEEKLIEAVRVRKVLYDTSHKDYLKTKLKAEKWEEVAKETDIRSAQEVKKKWRGLRDIFRREYIRVATHQAADSGEEYIPKWPYYKIMLFVKDTMTSRDLKGSAPSEVEEGSSDESESESVHNSTTENDSGTASQIPSPQTKKPSTSRRVFKSPLKKTAKWPREVSGFNNKPLQIVEEKLKFFKENIEDSEMLFLTSLHPFLKQIPPSRQLAVRVNIMRALMSDEAAPQYSPSQRPFYQSSGDEFRSECSSSHSDATYTVLRNVQSTSPTPTLPNQQELPTFFINFDSTAVDINSPEPEKD